MYQHFGVLYFFAQDVLLHKKLQQLQYLRVLQ